MSQSLKDRIEKAKGIAEITGKKYFDSVRNDEVAAIISSARLHLAAVYEYERLLEAEKGAQCKLGRT